MRDWSPDGWWRATGDPLGSAQVLFDVALVVPAGFAWTLDAAFNLVAKLVTDLRAWPHEP